MFSPSLLVDYLLHKGWNIITIPYFLELLFIFSFVADALR
ncbi:hypothetical protein FDUTEX481_01914 [Tolypothrix sp. PCC 7601]|nr:hypothetical protein FDUTEX481_01914 [Tolypothrix sp. PCC 7601]